MRDLVTHVPTGIVLDLNADDYGHPDGITIIGELHGKLSRAEAQLLCAKHGSPLYLQMRPTYRGSTERQMWGVHFDGSESHRPPSAGVSDEHKRQTEYVVRAAERAGFSTATEMRLDSNIRPDAVLYGPTAVGVEVQRSSLAVASAIRRTKQAVAGGLSTSIWISDRASDDRPAWFSRVPSVAMNQLPWDVIPASRSVTAIGLRCVEETPCEWGRFEVCPERRHGRPRFCGGWHPKLIPWAGMTLDDVAAGAPGGEVVPFQVGKHVHLVPPESIDLYEEFTERPYARLDKGPQRETSYTLAAQRVECHAIAPPPSRRVTEPAPLASMRPCASCGSLTNRRAKGLPHCHLCAGQSIAQATQVHPAAPERPAGLAPPGWSPYFGDDACWLCGDVTYMRDEQGRPTHVVCATAGRH